MKSVDDLRHDFEEGLGSEVANLLTAEEYSLLLKDKINDVKRLDLASKADLHRAGLTSGTVNFLMEGQPSYRPLHAILNSNGHCKRSSGF